MNKFRFLYLFLAVALMLPVEHIPAEPVSAQSVPTDFGLPYYGTGPKWTGGPHQWTKGPTEQFMDLYTGSGMDFAERRYNPETQQTEQVSFRVASMSEGNVIWASEVDEGGGLGKKVAVRHDGGSILIYGHLASIESAILTAIANGENPRVHPGDPIGMSGSSGTDNNHLHIELRDGSNNCCSSQGNGGNPISWHSKRLNGYMVSNLRPNELGIPPYCVPGNCNPVAYNYDGVAVRVAGVHGDWYPVPYETYSFYDYTGAKRTGVYAYLPEDYNCSQDPCEGSYHPRVIYAGHGTYGSFGEGGTMVSSFTEPQSNPGGSGSGQIGDSAVDIWEYKNYTGAQYGSSDPSAGIINMPGGQNDRNGSVNPDTNWSVMVYQEFDGQGGSRCINQPIPNLEYSVFDNGVQIINGISSFRVYNDSTCGGQMPSGVSGGDTVTVYAGTNWQGTQYGGSGTASFNLPDYIEGATSSIGVYPGKSALAYELDNFQGGTQCFTGSDSDLRDNFYDNGNIIDDNIHSLQLFENGNCSGWQPPIPTPLPTPIPAVIEGVYNTWSGGLTTHLAFTFSNADPNATHAVVWTCDGQVDSFTGAYGPMQFDHTCPTYGNVSAIITVYGEGGIPTSIGSPNVNLPAPTATHTPIPTNTPVPASSGGWRTEYRNLSCSGAFPPENLTWTPDYVSSDNQINHNWQQGSPAPGIGEDCFAVTWTQDLEFEGGNYTFTTNSDDGVRVYVDNNIVLNAWYDHGPQTDQSTAQVSAGVHEIKVEYYEHTGGAEVEFGFSQYVEPTETPVPTLTNTPTQESAVTEAPAEPVESSIAFVGGFCTGEHYEVRGQVLDQFSQAIGANVWITVSGVESQTGSGQDGYFVHMIYGARNLIGQSISARLYDNTTAQFTFEQSHFDSCPVEPTETPVPTETDLPIATDTPVPTVTDTPVPPVTEVELLTSPWYLSGDNSDDQEYQSLSSDALNGKTELVISIDVHEACLLSGDNDNSIIIDQNGWNIIKLSSYINNCQDGLQTITVPLSAFVNIDGGPNLDPNQPVGTLHVRIWLGSPFTVNITSIKAR